MSIWKKSIHTDSVNTAYQGTLMGSLGIKITAIENDGIVGTMPVDERTFQPMRLLHGGASVALAETLGSLGAHLAVDNNKTCVGLEINANHVKSATSGFVTGKAKPLHMGRSTQVWETRITNESGELICISRLTVAVKDI